MFDIEYKGGNTVVISSKQSVIVVDPKLSLIGLPDLKLKDCIEVLTERRLGLDSDTSSIVIDGPGEYEVSDFALRGVAASRHIDTLEQERLATLYRVEVGDVRLAIIGNVQPKLTDDQLEAIGTVDILIIPVGGGGYTIDAVDAAALVASIEPKVIVPVHYADSSLTYEVAQDRLDMFTTKLGAPVETTSKYKVKSMASLPSTLTVVEITRS